jgi:hypothetical protein
LEHIMKIFRKKERILTKRLKFKRTIWLRWSDLMLKVSSRIYIAL